ncbi:hypothetical protein JXB12_12150 [candidate division KSB1 bacterium]|nr:hypothetical protein [candidate division KSB1 bacterium]
MVMEFFKWLMKLIWTLILLSVLFFLGMFVFKTYHIDKALMFMGLSIGLGLVFVLIDVVIHEANRNGSCGNNPKEKHVYRPDFQVWSIGFILGIGLPILYYFIVFITTLTGSSFKNGISQLENLNLLSTNYFTVKLVTSYCQIAFFHNFVILLFLGVILGLIVWAIVKLSQSN